MLRRVELKDTRAKTEREYSDVAVDSIRKRFINVFFLALKHENCAKISTICVLKLEGIAVM